LFLQADGRAARRVFEEDGTLQVCFAKAKEEEEMEV
jgi:hypothetical protein